MTSLTSPPRLRTLVRKLGDLLEKFSGSGDISLTYSYSSFQFIAEDKNKIDNCNQLLTDRGMMLT